MSIRNRNSLGLPHLRKTVEVYVDTQVGHQFLVRFCSRCCPTWCYQG